MKITINIKDNKVGFFLELLQSFDFISIEKTEDNTEISVEHKKILDERLANYKSDPDNLLDWDDVKKDIEEGLK
jgi:hypothetical protein